MTIIIILSKTLNYYTRRHGFLGTRPMLSRIIIIMTSTVEKKKKNIHYVYDQLHILLLLGRYCIDHKTAS